MPSVRLRAKTAFLLGLLLLLILGAQSFGLRGQLSNVRGWIQDTGFWAPFLFTGIYIVAVVAALPGSALTIAAGALFGTFWGLVLVSLGSTAGAGLAFLLARYFMREKVSRWLAGNLVFRRLDQLTESRGGVIVALTRLIPLFPFNLLNYGFGLTRVRFWTYLFWSWLCMLPATVLFVAGGDVVSRGISQNSVPASLLLVLICSAVLLAGLTQFARRKLRLRSAKADSA